jgi:hypothetical protein
MDAKIIFHFQMHNDLRGIGSSTSLYERTQKNNQVDPYVFFGRISAGRNIKGTIMKELFSGFLWRVYIPLFALNTTLGRGYAKPL